jgi:hypothetical protein
VPLRGLRSAIQEAIDDVFQDEAVVNHEGLINRARGGGEIAAKGITTVSPERLARGLWKADGPENNLGRTQDAGFFEQEPGAR